MSNKKTIVQAGPRTQSAIRGSITLHVPERYGSDTQRQFEPSTETHNFGFLVKIVDPGCTLEVQIEERSGRVTRITTTESRARDKEVIHATVLQALDRTLQEFGL